LASCAWLLTTSVLIPSQVRILSLEQGVDDNNTVGAHGMCEDRPARMSADAISKLVHNYSDRANPTREVILGEIGSEESPRITGKFRSQTRTRTQGERVSGG
jgi:hypothetical protein